MPFSRRQLFKLTLGILAAGTEANLIVETLQGHTRERGDLTLILKAALGLQAGSPFADGEALSLDTPR